jgi:hypothetical protein
MTVPAPARRRGERRPRAGVGRGGGNAPAAPGPSSLRVEARLGGGPREHFIRWPVSPAVRYKRSRAPSMTRTDWLAHAAPAVSGGHHCARQRPHVAPAQSRTIDARLRHGCAVVSDGSGEAAPSAPERAGTCASARRHPIAQASRGVRRAPGAISRPNWVGPARLAAPQYDHERDGGRMRRRETPSRRAGLPKPV